jgi:hypothetical protein
MVMKSVKELVLSEDKALRNRGMWEGTWGECYDYTMPGSNGFTSSSPGGRGDELIFDETAVVGVQEFTSRMIQGVVPNNSRWVRLEPAPAAVAELSDSDIKTIQDDLDAVTEYAFEVINNSNFSTEAHEAFHDLAVSTGNMTIEEGDSYQPIKFSAVPLSEVALERGPFDGVAAQYRKRKIRVDMIQVIWPKAVLSQEMIKMKAEKPYEEIVLSEATYRDWTQPNEFIYYYCVYHKGSEFKVFSDEFVGLGSSPWVNFRWAKLSNEVYGRGPVFNSLAAIKTANLTVQLILENAELALSGVWQGDDDGVLNPANTRLIPGTIIPRSPGSRGLEALQFPGNFDVSQLVLNEMRYNINKALYNETLGRREGTPISATEVAERMGELAKQLGATYGRLQTEFVVPTMQRILYLLKKQGRIDLPQVDGREIKIRAVSPMMRAQRNEDISQHINFASVVGQLFGPQMVQTIINPTAFSEKLASWYEVEGTLIRDQQEQNQLAEQVSQNLSDAPPGSEEVITQLKDFLP